MTPYWSDDHLTLYGGDCRDVLAELPAGSVHTVVTSPPYWGLRDYGVGGQLGLEATPEEFVANMVAVFREVKRVLRDDGTLWLNLGDSYAGNNAPGRAGSKMSGLRQQEWGDLYDPDLTKHAGRDRNYDGRGAELPPGLKPKDLVGIPWRVAFALQADGWYLRSDIIWAKPNPMPESVTDRPTKAHEYLFLLSKSARYYYDADAVREAAEYGRRDWSDGRIDYDGGMTGERRKVSTTGGDPSAGRNLRTVWTIATEPYPGAHFATFPRKLVEPCVKAGTSERGVCPECGAPWEREVERTPMVIRRSERRDTTGKHSDASGYMEAPATSTTTGWRPSCAHDAEPVPATVLDPFAGSGTTLLVAQALGRRGVGIDLSPDYLRQALERNAQTPLGLVG